MKKCLRNAVRISGFGFQMEMFPTVGGASVGCIAQHYRNATEKNAKINVKTAYQFKYNIKDCLILLKICKYQIYYKSNLFYIAHMVCVMSSVPQNALRISNFCSWIYFQFAFSVFLPELFRPYDDCGV